MFLGQSMGHNIRRSESSRHYEEDRQRHRRSSRQRSKPKPKRRRQAEQSLKKKKRRRTRSKRQDESRSQKLVGQQLLLEEEGQKGSTTLLQIEDAEHHESRALVPYTQNENNNDNVAAGVELVPHTNTKPRRRSSIEPEGSSASLAYAELSAADIIRQSVLGLPDEETKEDDAYSVILSGLQSSADDVLAKKKALPKYVKTK